MTDFSSPGSEPTPWADTLVLLQGAEIFWLSTVRPDGRPHVTPLITVWADGALHFCTGRTERKARNLATNPGCVLTTGTNLMSEGLDVVLEGAAVRITEDHTLRRLADRWACKYDWHFEVRDGAFWDSEAPTGGSEPGEQAAGEAYVFRVQPTTVHAYGRGEDYTATRWRFEDGASVKA
ncbi:pyridoxamine 5'-phosphate oxidase family protein [Oerskovia turbata]|uniref:Pyridoxamine 5'-phosphate oxidase family protein n=2 Tax=Oerskovia turbata TaxID=1713 RepID=A0A4Q1L211_9CELL|nr:pyridoxamine 5'-phosphate oxidase family protein [Oerskovia turbata]RXR36830.1 pyridoxamine 5'-phosphate oxidase family protein [Oerskovia turbata]TGJ98077.1 pyridoxamine 5'-phosphate oxidase [Actinotalea fermentans ATCC 43279 = JCM 9966 = DSM 3133]